MCRLFETIKILNGRADNLEFHAARMNRSRKELFGCDNPIELDKVIILPERCNTGTHKCRVTYSTGVDDITFEPYERRIVKTLRIISCDRIEYSHKYCDRTMIDSLFRMRGDCDDILIIKNNQVTDTSIGNIVFYDGSRWVTPDRPLLRGTKRERLLSRGIIMEARIGVPDMAGFKKSCLINAMLDLDQVPIEIGNIIQSDVTSRYP